MASNDLSNISTEKLRKRKKVALFLVWLLYGIAVINLGIVIYLLTEDRWDASNVFTIILIPVFMGFLLIIGIVRINKELKSRIN